MIPENIKNWIDNASYESLLEKHRNAPIGSPFFQGEAGAYYNEKMYEKRIQISCAAHVAHSKSIGWDG